MNKKQKTKNTDKSKKSSQENTVTSKRKSLTLRTPNSEHLFKSKNKNKKSKCGLYNKWEAVYDENVPAKSQTKRQMNLVEPISSICEFLEGYGRLKRLVYKQISGKGFKIEYELGNMKYFTKWKLEEYVDKAAIPVGEVGY